LEAVEQALMANRLSPENLDIRRTLERARGAALRAARAILRGSGAGGRANAKRDSRYRALMEAYRQAGVDLNESTISVGAASTGIAPETNAPAHMVAAGPGLSAAPPKSTARTKISLLMIVKNEERFLRNCLESARDVVDELIIVDTGSTDATIQIATEYGARIVRHEWNDDFSEARNMALAHATGDWGLWLDADEEIAPGSGSAFRKAAETAGPAIGGFMVSFQNWLQSTTRDPNSDMAVHHACRLFRLAPGVRFEGRIHEQNLRSLQELGYQYAYTPGLTIDHFGYASEIMAVRNKHERFIRMLTREVEECPDPSLREFHLFNLGNAYFTLGDMANTVKYLRMAAAKPDLKEEFTATVFTELVTALQQTGRSEEGLEVCARADEIGLEHPGVDFARGYCLLHLLRYKEAEASFRRALRLGRTAAPTAQSGDRGTSSYKARYGLALAMVGQERYREAETECREALRDREGFVEARYLLAVMLTNLKRWEEARGELLNILERQPDHESARQDLARISFELGGFEDAVSFFEAAARAEPEDYQINAKLAVCYERTERHAAACAVYERLQAIAPDSAEVCVNMGRAMASAGSDAEALACFVKAIRIDPQYSNAYFNAGDLLYRNAQFDDAANSYIAGLEVNPDHPSGFFVLGNCLFQQRNYAAAAELYRQELKLDPNHDQARSNLKLAEGLLAEMTAA
jgi:tetratricopeptide (TPR) repeat protein